MPINSKKKFTIGLIDENENFKFISNNFNCVTFANQFSAIDTFKTLKVDYIISSIKSKNIDGFEFSNKLKHTINKHTPYVLITTDDPKIYHNKILSYNVKDVYSINDTKKIINHLKIYKKISLYNDKIINDENIIFKIISEKSKRVVDITVATSALIITFPIMLLVFLILKLRKGGAAIYTSTRIGTNFKSIKLYKFRTMIVDADQKINQLKSLNEYISNDIVKKDKYKPSGNKLIGDNMHSMDEEEYLHEVRNTPVFLKFKADPRVTPFGKFLRKTSIDELPQLFNILIGDISLVGNRPVTTLEADKLTTDDKIARFLSPAGLTGYWQITKRGTANISQSDRIKMDIYYAKKRSILFDLKIIIKTFKALIQTENH